jgi:hypothetical protein
VIGTADTHIISGAVCSTQTHINEHSVAGKQYINNTHLKITSHGMSFPRSRLAIAEYTHAITIHNGLYELRCTAEHLLLSGFRVEGMVEFEDVTGTGTLGNLKETE